MTTKKTIYIIRHGQTDYNLRGIIQGSGINSDINETGRGQAEMFHKHYGDYPFSHIYTSGLKRTHQTVAPFNHGTTPITALDAFNEINWGKFEGKTLTPEIRTEFYHILGQWSEGNLDLAADGGESPNTMAAKQRAGIDQVMDESGMNDILICTHGRAIRSLVCVLLNTSLKNMAHFEHTNLSLYKFETLNGRDFTMTLRNEVSHLNSASN